MRRGPVRRHHVLHAQRREDRRRDRLSGAFATLSRETVPGKNTIFNLTPVDCSLEALRPMSRARRCRAPPRQTRARRSTSPPGHRSSERGRLEKANQQRAARRGYLVFATDPSRSPDEAGYREVFATEAKTPGEATAKIRPLAEGRRLRTFLATGTYKDELADARWVA